VGQLSDSAGQAGPHARQCFQALGADGNAALLAHAVHALFVRNERPFEVLAGTPRLVQQCDHPLALISDGGALRIMLVVAVGRLGGRDDPGVLELEPSDVDGVSRQILQQPLKRLGHVKTNTARPAPLPQIGGVAQRPFNRVLGLGNLVCELLRVASDGSVVARQVRRQGRQGNGHRLPLTSQVGKRQRQEGRHRAVQIVGRGVGLGGQENQCVLWLAKIPERAGHLDDGTPTTFAHQACVDRGRVQRNCAIWVARGVKRCTTLEQPDGASRRQFGDQGVDAAEEIVRGVTIHFGPEFRNLFLPIGGRDTHTFSISDHGPSCILRIPEARSTQQPVVCPTLPLLARERVAGDLTKHRLRALYLGNRHPHSRELDGGDPMTNNFRVAALPTLELDLIRARGVDDFGNSLVVTVNHDEGGAPLRCCLQEAAVGERVALIAYQPAAVGGAYAEVGPVFIHADPCSGYGDGDSYPAGFRARHQLFRAYDADGRQVDNQIIEGQHAEAAIAELFARPEVG